MQCLDHALIGNGNKWYETLKDLVVLHINAISIGRGTYICAAIVFYFCSLFIIEE